MLVTEGLYFARIDCLGDAYEGWIPELSAEHYDGWFGDDDIQRDKTLRAGWKDWIKHFFVSCWHANNDQSDAMWKLYVKGNEGVAIRTTCRKLKASLQNAPEQLHLYEVMYAEPNKRLHGGYKLRACMTKRKAFEHEKEVRIVHEEPLTSCRKKEELRRGFYVKCKMATLIEKVYIAPTAHPWFEPIIKDVLSKYAIPAKVEQSGLNLKPTWGHGKGSGVK